MRHMGKLMETRAIRGSEVCCKAYNGALQHALVLLCIGLLRYQSSELLLVDVYMLTTYFLNKTLGCLLIRVYIHIYVHIIYIYFFYSICALRQIVDTVLLWNQIVIRGRVLLLCIQMTLIIISLSVIGMQTLSHRFFFQVSDPALAAMGYDQSADLWSLGVVLWHGWMAHDISWPFLLVRCTQLNSNVCWEGSVDVRNNSGPSATSNIKGDDHSLISHAMFQRPKACFHATAVYLMTGLRLCFEWTKVCHAPCLQHNQWSQWQGNYPKGWSPFRSFPWSFAFFLMAAVTVIAIKLHSQFIGMIWFLWAQGKQDEVSLQTWYPLGTKCSMLISECFWLICTQWWAPTNSATFSHCHELFTLTLPEVQSPTVQLLQIPEIRSQVDWLLPFRKWRPLGRSFARRCEQFDLQTSLLWAGVECRCTGTARELACQAMPGLLGEKLQGKTALRAACW